MQKLNMKRVGMLFGAVVVLSLIAGFFTATNHGRAVLFALTDPETTLQAKHIKHSYVSEFKLGLE